MQSLDDLEPDHAASVSKDALQLMAELEVPATPPNFTVWFAYVLGRSAALRKTIDILRSNDRKFDKTLNRELYNTFLKATGSVGEVAQTIPASSTQSLSTLETTFQARSQIAQRIPRS
ncbi:hypothetical protein [Bradyrhizobium sp. 164]|uniref:hypothetical protein n=1 Tax=Bradyrhizobium sp. 164 TaxID=2782637 RepID=UPI001FFB44F9|nr:hypothetical protein [Bradyrhizobium sp. 164]MCK1597937.1 hypothetical protein [Bradyrhizobium sp. 164]